MKIKRTRFHFTDKYRRQRNLRERKTRREAVTKKISKMRCIVCCPRWITAVYQYQRPTRCITTAYSTQMLTHW